MKREKFLKSGQGREWIRENVTIQGLTRNRKPFFNYKKFNFQPDFQPFREKKPAEAGYIIILMLFPGIDQGRLAFRLQRLSQAIFNGSFAFKNGLKRCH